MGWEMSYFPVVILKGFTLIINFKGWHPFVNLEHIMREEIWPVNAQIYCSNYI